MSINSIQDTYTLNNGSAIPCFGLGTYLYENGKTGYDCVRVAIEKGYRLIDTASYYANEAVVGAAVRDSNVAREKLFVVSKLWNADQGFDSTLKAFDKSMDALGLDYLDLYLIHWPIAKGHQQDWAKMNRETWRAMERLYEQGRIRAIGVSNFKPHHIDALMQTAKIAPMVNQIEIHPGFNQDETVSYCRTAAIAVEAWSPLGRAKVLNDKTLLDIASAHNKSAAQVCLRWLVQRNIIPLPKSANPERIAQNADIFDFCLDDGEMRAISDMNRIDGGWDSDKVAY